MDGPVWYDRRGYTRRPRRGATTSYSDYECQAPLTGTFPWLPFYSESKDEDDQSYKGTSVFPRPFLPLGFLWSPLFPVGFLSFPFCFALATFPSLWFQPQAEPLPIFEGGLLHQWPLGPVESSWGGGGPRTRGFRRFEGFRRVPQVPGSVSVGGSTQFKVWQQGLDGSVSK